METLTQRQTQILAFIEKGLHQHGAPPSVREIARHFGFKSPRAVSDHLDALERKGYIHRAAGQARNVQLVRSTASDLSDRPSFGIPIVGDVAAGLPILAEENVLGSLDMASSFGAGDLFAVRVRGDSMEDYGILDGDHVIVRRTPVVDNNAIAVVYIDGEATVKKLRKTAFGFELVPGNARYAITPITADTPGFAVAGPVVGVVRSMSQLASR